MVLINGNKNENGDNSGSIVMMMMMMIATDKIDKSLIGLVAWSWSLGKKLIKMRLNFLFRNVSGE